MNETKARNIRKEAEGAWGVNIFFGDQFVRRSYYISRAAARNADASDGAGSRGCIAMTQESMETRVGKL